MNEVPNNISTAKFRTTPKNTIALQSPILTCNVSVLTTQKIWSVALFKNNQSVLYRFEPFHLGQASSDRVPSCSRVKEAAHWGHLVSLEVDRNWDFVIPIAEWVNVFGFLRQDAFAVGNFISWGNKLNAILFFRRNFVIVWHSLCRNSIVMFLFFGRKANVVWITFGEIRLAPARKLASCKSWDAFLVIIDISNLPRRY